MDFGCLRLRKHLPDAPGREFAAAQLGEAPAPNQKGEADSIQSGSPVPASRQRVNGPVRNRVTRSELCLLFSVSLWLTRNG